MDIISLLILTGKFSFKMMANGVDVLLVEASKSIQILKPFLSSFSNNSFRLIPVFYLTFTVR